MCADFSCIRLLRKAASLPLSHAYLLQVIDMLLPLSLFLSLHLSMHLLATEETAAESYLGPLRIDNGLGRVKNASDLNLLGTGRQTIDRFLLLSFALAKKERALGIYSKSQCGIDVCVCVFVCGRIPVKHGMTLLFVCLQEYLYYIFGLKPRLSCGKIVANNVRSAVNLLTIN